MVYNTGDFPTIAALATAPSPAGLAVIRISGVKTRALIHSIFRSNLDPTSHPRRAILGEVIDMRSSDVIDVALVIFMPKPSSYTGEDVVEFQFHGSPLLVQKILRSIYATGVEAASPGEFTKRAFLNGKLDLIQAEAIADLILARSEEALKLASEQLRGRLSKALEQVGEPLRDIVARIEASVDFPEEDIPSENRDELAERLEHCRVKVGELLHTYEYGHAIREGFRVLLCGRPNVGKSSLLNTFLGKPRAIVTPVSGTTRDLLEEECILGGYKFVFCDSAGITCSDDVVERIGIELAKEKISWADLVMLIVDATDTAKEYEEVLEYLRGKAKKIWMVTNKIDLNPAAIGTFYCDSRTCQQNFYISVQNNDGIEALTSALVEEISSGLTDTAEASQVVTNERHRNCLQKAFNHIGEAITSIKQNVPLEIVSADIRFALTALDEIVGVTHTEDLLGRIFAKFCVGK